MYKKQIWVGIDFNILKRSLQDRVNNTRQYNTTELNTNSWLPEFYTVQEVAEIMKMGNNKIYKLFKTDGFPAIKIGHDYRVEKSRFNKWINDYAGREYKI